MRYVAAYRSKTSVDEVNLYKLQNIKNVHAWIHSIAIEEKLAKMFQIEEDPKRPIVGELFLSYWTMTRASAG